MGRGSKPKEDRTRTFTGCRTCRSRHAKCDEEVPECGICRRLGLTCEGYAPRLFWMTDEATLPAHQRQPSSQPEYRFQLFSEDERRELSLQLAESANYGAGVDRLLVEVDAAYNKHGHGHQGDLAACLKGPFGVFSSIAATGQDDSPTSSSSQAYTASNSYDPATTIQDLDDAFLDTASVIHSIQQSSDAEPINFTASTFDASNYGNDQAVMISPTLCAFLSDFVSDPQDLSVSGLGFEDLSSLDLSIGLNQEENEKDQDANTVQQQHDHQMYSTDVVPINRAPSHGTSSIPEHAVSLLRFYKQYLERNDSLFKSPRPSAWQIIFLPLALETFSEVSLWNTTSHTRSAILSTLLANSAFLLHNAEASPDRESSWRDVGSRYLIKAQDHLNSALQHEAQGSKKARYKELLMAILALTVTSLYQNTKVFRRYLVEAEKLIRLAGLSREDLRNKPRILHHMYSHLRVIAESVTLALPFEQGQPVNDIDQQQSIVSTRAFHISGEALNVGLDGALVKSQELGLSDIHLETQGRWTRTMFPDIYGVPESLMTLLSQTVSLANEKNTLESQAHLNPRVHVALSHHIKTLETTIWSWTLEEELFPKEPKRPHPEVSEDTELLNHHLAQFMTRAIHQALILYFYRRIHNVSAMLLQDTVRRCLDHLEICIEDLINDQDFALSLAWPAFITGCEAVTPALQERALHILDKMDNRRFFFIPRPSKEIVSQVWEKRKQSGDFTVSWVSMMSAEIAA